MFGVSVLAEGTSEENPSGQSHGWAILYRMVRDAVMFKQMQDEIPLAQDNNRPVWLGESEPEGKLGHGVSGDHRGLWKGAGTMTERENFRFYPLCLFWKNNALLSTVQKCITIQRYE